MDQISGYVTSIIYRNKENTYTVFEVEEDGDLFTCTGFPAQIAEGESCEVTGEFVEHPTYGQQFKVAEYKVVAPKTRQAIFRYLSSGAIKGIGEPTARKIIKHFGDDTMKILDEEPERLKEIKGISERKAREIAAQLEERRDVRDAIMFLQQYGISNKQALKIWGAYGMDIYTILKENPYRLADDIDGIGFARADEIATRIGITPDSDFRVRSGLVYVLQQALQEGNTYLPMNELVMRSRTLLHVPEETVRLQIDNLAVDRRIRCKVPADGGEISVYGNHAFYLEQQIARMLLDLARCEVPSYDPEEIARRIREIEVHEDIHLDDLQRKAVEQAASGAVLVMSGGPGTGKTTTINTIIRYFISDVKAVLLAAPTGRAAKRMSEATGYEAMTIHRLLGYKAVGDEEDNSGAQEIASYRFERGEDNPLEADVVIIDEMSMVDLYLCHALLRAIKPGTRLVLVGDVNQLPSVGPGRILQDIIESGSFKTVMLEKIFRQAQKSDIIMNAHKILAGQPLTLDNHSQDFFFLERSDANVIYKHMTMLIRDKLPGYVQCKPDEIQVLTPMRKGALGAIRLNEVLQSVLNPPAPDKKEYAAHESVFRVGDKVMQTRNNYQMEWQVPGNFGMPIDSGTGIFNGDFGTIRSIDDKARSMTILFDEGRVVDYPFDSLEDLDLAYAITVHKSQGSEYPAVILPLLSGPSTLFYRNLLYTGVTRARKCVVVLGSKEVLGQMIHNVSQNTRYTGLRERIHEIAGDSIIG